MEETMETQHRARLAIFELVNMLSVPMSLNAIVRLNVPNAIWQGGANTALTASQIVSKVLPSDGGDAENLQRILRMLTSYGVFAEVLHDTDRAERKYSLTEIGKMLVTDANGLSCKSYVLQHFQDKLMKAWPLVHEAVVDPTSEPFVKVNSEPAYTYYGKRLEMTGLMQKAMSGVPVPFMKAMLEAYSGFDGIQRLVDVGGSTGHCLRMICPGGLSISA
ncbi:hypothetical protein SLEP1_g48806 [Rubroshorea leprosula]|uniref:O-methyltransferase dimerisation domain-containing protein n=1 Tax=Rubroshorea leprosula TaxID=152421 RepID=A0AAV5LUQ1_9ROSI|nr:hypothetical protein SLEP1_g48806 [Rubroshorea leprosula]